MVFVDGWKSKSQSEIQMLQRKQRSGGTREERPTEMFNAIWLVDWSIGRLFRCFFFAAFFSSFLVMCLYSTGRNKIFALFSVVNGMKSKETKHQQQQAVIAIN